MVKVMSNDQLVYKVVISALFGISLWREKVALNKSPGSQESMVYVICLYMYK